MTKHTGAEERLMKKLRTQAALMLALTIADPSSYVVNILATAIFAEVILYGLLELAKCKTGRGGK